MHGQRTALRLHCVSRSGICMLPFFLSTEHTSVTHSFRGGVAPPNWSGAREFGGGHWQYCHLSLNIWVHASIYYMMWNYDKWTRSSSGSWLIQAAFLNGIIARSQTSHILMSNKKLSIPLHPNMIALEWLVSQAFKRPRSEKLIPQKAPSPALAHSYCGPSLRVILLRQSQ